MSVAKTADDDATTRNWKLSVLESVHYSLINIAHVLSVYVSLCVFLLLPYNRTKNRKLFTSQAVGISSDYIYMYT